MNLKDFLFFNSEIEHNVRAIVRLQMIKEKMGKQLNKSDSILVENIDKKLKINRDLIQQYLNRSYITVDYEDIESYILKIVQKLLDEYDATKSYKENYSKVLLELENVSLKDENMVDKEIEDNEIKNDEEDIEDDFDNKKNDKTKIEYTVENDKYNIEEDGIFTGIPIKIYGYDSNKLKQIYCDDYDDIFKEVDKEKIKNHDPRLLFFLWQKIGKKASNEYLKEFSKGKDADKSKLSYEMIYNMKKIKNNKVLSKKEKKMLLKIARKNKNVAIVEQDKKKNFKRLLAGVVSGLFVFCTGDSLAVNKGEIKSLKQGEKIEYDNTKDSKNDNNKLNFLLEYKASSEEIDNKLGDRQNINIKDLGIESEQTQKILKEFKLGDVLYLGEGINYSEDSMGGGRKGETGVTPWRPAGNYEINGVSILDSENNIVTFAVNQKELNVLEYIKKNLSENGRVAFHINMLQDGESKPTGWVESARILEALEEKTRVNEIERG